jgi:hypothetical protein
MTIEPSSAYNSGFVEKPSDVVAMRQHSFGLSVSPHDS